METTLIVGGIAVLLIVFFVAQYNRLIRLNVAVDEAFDAVITARAKATTASTVADVSAADGMLTQALRGLLAVAEAYPDLKASANFMSLQEELSTTENKVAFSRQFYNDSVRLLNTAVKTIPTNFFAGFAKVDEREFYEVDEATNRNAPNVSF
jgi:LemA protein